MSTTDPPPADPADPSQATDRVDSAETALETSSSDLDPQSPAQKAKMKASIYRFFGRRHR